MMGMRIDMMGRKTHILAYDIGKGHRKLGENNVSARRATALSTLGSADGIINNANGKMLDVLSILKNINASHNLGVQLGSMGGWASLTKKQRVSQIKSDAPSRASIQTPLHIPTHQHKGECPSTGIQIIPFRTEASINIYVKLKSILKG